LNVPCPNCGRVNRPGARYCASCQTPLSTAAARLQPAQSLAGGTYRVVRSLGKGGMGAVWLVAQTKAFDRLAVVKEVIDYFDPADAEARQNALQRFEAEARTLGDLKHPGIPDLYAYFTEGGHNYLVMEYIEGQDLRQGLTRQDGDTGQLIPGGPLPDEQVLRYGIEISRVLEYLERHQPPVVHNDIKPGNIIVDKNSGRAVLVDFGTAKTRYLHADNQPQEGKASVYGTVGYAAPELYQGHSEARSDVYSLAATVYHLLTDDDPRDHPFQYPQLDTLPADLAGILQAALAHEEEERLTATQFRQQLERYLAGQSAPLRTLPTGMTELLTTSIRLPQVGVGQQIRQEIRIANRGHGHLRGQVLSSRPWVRVGSGMFTCPPGQTTSIPVDIDAAGLEPGQSYLAAVTLMPTGSSPEVVPVQITVARPAIRLTPAEVDLGTVSRRDLSTARRSVTVTSVSQAVAQCRVLGAPEWLLVKPEAFRLQPGAQQNVELVGRVDKVRGRRLGVVLTIALDGGDDQRLEVRLRVKGGLFG
jgi:serine/threonine protein kinase